MVQVVRINKAGPFANTLLAIGKAGAYVWDIDFQGDYLVWMENFTSGVYLYDTEIFALNIRNGKTQHLTRGLGGADYFSYVGEPIGVDSGPASWSPFTNGEIVLFNYSDLSIGYEANPNFGHERLLEYNLQTGRIEGATKKYWPDQHIRNEYGVITYSIPDNGTERTPSLRGDLFAYDLEGSTNGSKNQFFITELSSGEHHLLDNIGGGWVSRYSISENRVSWESSPGWLNSFNTKDNSLYRFKDRDDHHFVLIGNDDWMISEKKEYIKISNSLLITSFAGSKPYTYELATSEMFPGISPGHALEPSLIGLEIIGNKLIGSFRRLASHHKAFDWLGEMLDISSYSDPLFIYDLRDKTTEILLPQRLEYRTGKYGGLRNLNQSISNDSNVYIYSGFSGPDSNPLDGYVAYNSDTLELKLTTNFVDLEPQAISSDGATFAFGSNAAYVTPDIWNRGNGISLLYERYRINENGSIVQIMTSPGTLNNDFLRGNNLRDLISGGKGDDKLIGRRGPDSLVGGQGNDELRAGNGRDIITGGAGGDTMYGGFGLNTFEDEADGAVDSLYFKSDQWAENWIYGKAGNSPNGQKADKITELDSFDRIYVQGVATSQLSYGAVSHQSNLGETLSGVGIYASGYLEAVYVGDNLNLGQIAAMTQGILL